MLQCVLQFTKTNKLKSQDVSP